MCTFLLLLSFCCCCFFFLYRLFTTNLLVKMLLLPQRGFYFGLQELFLYFFFLVVSFYLWCEHICRICYISKLNKHLGLWGVACKNRSKSTNLSFVNSRCIKTVEWELVHFVCFFFAVIIILIVTLFISSFFVHQGLIFHFPKLQCYLCKHWHAPLGSMLSLKVSKSIRLIASH